jgi:filamentous hemagglutinin family protein
MIKTRFLLSFLMETSLFASIQTAQAQTYQPSNRTPVADNTLGTQVSGNGNNFSITGGLTKGQTLFHSFTDFSVPTNGQANFLNPVGNRDIITRVTGGVFSDINGLLNSNGANFFLINPSGIVFGTNAQLNVGRAFMASTASGIDLVDGSGRAITFGTNPNGDAPLLSVAPNVLFDVSRLNMGGGNGAISNFGTLQTTNPNQSIGLIGGNITMNGGQINAPGGRVDLGGLSAFGTVALGTDVNNLRVQLPTNVVRGDVSLTNGARVNVTGAGGGDIGINAQNVDISNGSILAGGILNGFGTLEAVAGDIKINATGNIKLADNSAILNVVGTGAVGKGGAIDITTQNLSVTNGAQLQASTKGQGDAGKIKMTATGNISFDGIKDGFVSAALSRVEQGGVGKGGEIDITTQNFALSNGGQLGVSTLGRGDAGNIKINATSSISFDGKNDGFRSGVASTVENGAEGKGGSIEIVSRDFSATNSAGLSASTLGRGDAGNIKMTATGNVSFDDKSAVYSTVEQGALGKGGRIEITTENLSVTNGAQLQTLTRGQGNAGSVKITAAGKVSLDGSSTGVGSTVEQGGVGKGGGIEIMTRNLFVTDGATLSASTFDKGDAGNIKINATGNIFFAGGKDGFRSSAFSIVAPEAEGHGGSVEISSANLSLTNGAQLSSSTFGKGDAGSVKIRATGNVSFDGISSGYGSGVLSTVEKGGEGKGGNIEMSTANLSLTNGAQLQAAIKGKGDGGNIKIMATGNVSFDGKKDSYTTGAFSTVVFRTDGVRTEGKGGGIEIASRKLSITNGAILSASSDGTGNAGNISLRSNAITLNNGGVLSRSLISSGGDIKLITGEYLLLRNDSFISTDSGNIILSLLATDSSSIGGKDNGGNITINSPLIIALPGNNDITANAVEGKGGNLKITSQGLFGIQYRSKGQESLFTNDITASSEFGQQGIVNIDTPGTDPGKDSTQLPNAPADASNQISQVCSASNRQNKLTVTGRGGLPPTANDPLTSDVVWQDTRAASSQPVVSSATIPAKLAPPAVGWVFDGKGKVTLVAAGAGAQPTGNRVVCQNVVK